LHQVGTSSLHIDIFFWDLLTLQDGKDSLSRNVGQELPLYAAEYPRKARISNFYHITRCDSTHFLKSF